VVTAANAGGYASLAALAIGAVPVLADIRAADLTLDPQAALALVGPRTKAVVATHLYGQLAELAGLAAGLGGAGIALIEDCAQAHGAQRDGRGAGGFGLAATFSFYPSKNLGATGDGGAIVCDDDELAQRLRALRQYGWEERYRAVTPGGRNSRLDELQAAVLRVKLPRLAAWNEARRNIVARYRHAAEGTPLRLVHRPGPDYVAHLCVARHPERDAFRRRLAELGIASAIHYPFADHQQPAIAARALRPRPLPVSEAAVSEILTLPCFPEMSAEEVEAVAAAIRDLA
jgi:dTDP-4-amino-4,6-dideoxygalactose transaminase